MENSFDRGEPGENGDARNGIRHIPHICRFSGAWPPVVKLFLIILLIF
jgi:hypothetical protein